MKDMKKIEKEIKDEETLLPLCLTPVSRFCDYILILNHLGITG